MSESITGRLNEDRARAYVRRIRNGNKQAYGWRFLNYLLGYGDEGVREAEQQLSYMGAQAVRLELSRILGYSEPVSERGES